MFFSRLALRKAKNLPSAGAVDAATHNAARAQLLRALPDAVFESAPSSVGYFVGFAQSFVYKPVAASAAAVVFLAGGWMTTSAAQTSLPGDTLYNVKLITERAQLRVASLDRRAVLHTEFAGNRLEEVAALQRVVAEKPDKAPYISKTVTAYQQEIASATTDLQILQTQNQTQALTTAASVLDQVAMLTESAGQLAITTSANTQNASQISEEHTQDVAEQVVQTTEAIAKAAKNVAIESHELSPSIESTHEMESLFRSTLGAIETRRAMVLHRIRKIEEISMEQKAVLAQAGVVLPRKSVFTEMKSTLDDIDNATPSLMNDFAAGSFRSALGALEEIERILASMETNLTLVEEPIITALSQHEAELQAQAEAEAKAEADAQAEVDASAEINTERDTGTEIET